MLWRVSRCWTEYMKCDSPTEISETNVPNSYSTSLAVVSDLEKWSHKLVAGRDVQWTFQHLQLPNIRLEPWRCCCWQCYRLPAVEGGARFLVKPFIKLLAWKLLNWQISSFFESLKVERPKKLWIVSIPFFLPNGTMSRFKRHSR